METRATEHNIFALCIRSNTDVCTTLSEILDIDGTSPVLWQDAESHESCIYLYTEEETQLEEMERHVTHTCTQCAEFLPKGAFEITRISIPREEWAESWKQYFHTMRVGTHFVIVPRWENVAPASNNIVIRIDPGMAFGTGLHGTTRGCLELMEPFFHSSHTPNNFADIGCGSGILSIAAALCGCQKIYAYDNDPVAINVTRENCTQNKVSKNVNARIQDIYHRQLKRSFSFACANILATVLEDNCETLADCIEPGGYLVLSGMLTDQASAVEEKFTAHGLKKQNEREIDGWVTLLLHKSPALSFEP